MRGCLRLEAGVQFVFDVADPNWEGADASEADASPDLGPPDWPDRPRTPPSDGLDAAALLRPLADAAAALARLDARVEGADAAVADGLRARLALREAAGWLAHQHRTWVHPIDLALRDAGLTGSTTAAAMAGRLPTALPVTSALAKAAGTHTGGTSAELPKVPASGSHPEVAPAARIATEGADAAAQASVAEDLAVGQALQLARLWRRLAEHRGWPLDDAAALRETLARLGEPDVGETALAGWLARFAEPPAHGAAPKPDCCRRCCAPPRRRRPGHTKGQGRGACRL